MMAIWGSPTLMGDRSQGPFIALSATTGVGSGGSGTDDGPPVGLAEGVTVGSHAAVAPTAQTNASPSSRPNGDRVTPPA